MAEAAVKFRHRLLAVPAVTCHPVASQDDDGGLLWNNLLLSSPVFRHGHVETFEVPGRLSVLHVCVFPHVDDLSPIYGFDMIAGPSKTTGIFLDLSSTVDHAPILRLRNVIDGSSLDAFSERRSLPEWGKIFSPDILAIRPINLDEVKKAIHLGLQALDGLLAQPRARSASFAATISAGQQRYVDAQRQNDHTFRMLTNFIGKDRARQFIEEVLFPPAPVVV